MSDLNQTTFTGRLGADPEVRSFQNGGRVCNFRIAVGEQWKDKATGERKERTEWVSVAITNDGLVGIAERFLKKGSRIAISGKQQTRKWQDQSGNDRYSTECVLGFGGTMVMLDGKPEGSQQRTPDGSRGSPPPRGGFADDLDDNHIPFATNESIW